jgi:hypothetical protein
MSRNSPLESASAPSVEPRFHPSAEKFLKKLPHHRYHLSHRCGVDPGVDNLLPTIGLPASSLTTPSKSTMRPAAVSDCPQFTHNPTHLPRWADIGLSPMSTIPITVACISPKLLLRRRHLGTHRSKLRRADKQRLMSPRSISFQVEPESSTVVHRQSVRLGETRGEIPRNRWLDLIVVWIEGTLWTWRRQRLVSPI